MRTWATTGFELKISEEMGENIGGFGLPTAANSTNDY